MTLFFMSSVNGRAEVAQSTFSQRRVHDIFKECYLFIVHESQNDSFLMSSGRGDVVQSTFSEPRVMRFSKNGYHSIVHFR